LFVFYVETNIRRSCINKWKISSTKLKSRRPREAST